MKKLLLSFMIVFIDISSFSQETIKAILDKYNKELLLRLYIIGNFTNSGKTEVVAFYQDRSSEFIEGKPFYFISEIYCFIIENDRVDTVLKMPFEGTNYFNEAINLNLSPLGHLGKKIIWRDYYMGASGDFNKNGRDELYLYTVTGFSFYPSAFEFDVRDKKFKQILDYCNFAALVNLIEVDSVRKRLVFNEGVVRPSTEKKVFQWDESQQIYVRVKDD
jgi:hypothetical protein